MPDPGLGPGLTGASRAAPCWNGCPERVRTSRREAGLLRLTELLLFLTPFAAFVAWRLTAGSGAPPRALLIGTACVLAVLAGTLVWLSRERALPPGTAYVPAQLQNGRIVPGHAAPQ